MAQVVKDRDSAEREAGKRGWEPRIVAMVCNWCTYAGADMAGTTRKLYAPNVRTVRLLCSGRVDPVFILKAFEQGADGVLVSGCHPGDCHYVQGNMLTRRRLTVFRSFMEFLGLDRRRLHFAWVSASEGAKWSKVVDEVTEAVREVGPLRHWGKAISSNSSHPALLLDSNEKPQLSRSPSPEENERIAAHLQQTAATLLSEGKVSVVIGYAAGSLPGQMVPAFATNPEEASRLVWNDRCVNNLTVYLREAVKKKGSGKIGLVAKSCDAKALLDLQRENQLKREDVLLLGVPCAGIWENGRLAAKCYACPDEVSPLADWTITPEGAREGVVASGGERTVVQDPRDAQIELLESLSLDERWDYWQRQFARCIRCYACRAVCSMCYCTTCISDKHQPQWVPTTIDGKGNMSWNIVRAMHLAGRCVGCDECTRACPAGIRLDLINRRLSQEIERQFGYRSDSEPSVAPPLATFRPDDPDEFL